MTLSIKTFLHVLCLIFVEKTLFYWKGDRVLGRKDLDQIWHLPSIFHSWFKIIDMKNLSHEWLHDFVCIIWLLIYKLIGAHEVNNHLPLRFFIWIISNHGIKYTRQMPSLIRLFSALNVHVLSDPKKWDPTTFQKKKSFFLVVWTIRGGGGGLIH